MSADNLLMKLETYGADVTGAMERFLDDGELYAQCLDMFVDDENFCTLSQALEAKDYPLAFQAAHTLKGVCANLGLTPLLDAICGVVEPLRNHQYAGLAAQHEAVEAQLAALKTLL